MAVAWGSDTNSSPLTSVSTEQFFSQTPGLAANEYAVCQVSGLSSGTTDNLIISVYSTLDDSSEVWDTVPIFSITLNCTNGITNRVTFVVPDLYKFRVGVKRSGSSNTFTCNMSHRVATMS